ncbi:DUF4192 domain-containing protein [Intrasporangium sp.]|uniref:DUF4192 domain-containing protein n=1 Tax=Intrasporangium sp. TaxID=1925024 RepID=UPI00293975E0|nr:DUF4192 domain-containing protein [Intrasporangium sp.]MDV3223068.1 DUF4192 domain-containing protein [Intrasporangium sp.]
MQKISVSGPAELVTVVPYHLGFQPERSLVAICLQEKAIGLVARMDLVGSPHAAQAAAQLSEAICREGATAVALVAYETRPGEARPLADSLGAALGLAGIPVTEDLVVRDNRWFCLRSDDCPDEGEDLPAPADVPAVAGYVALGRAVLSDRAAMETLVTPAPEACDEGVVEAIEDWRGDYRDAVGGRWDELAHECFVAWGALVTDELSDAALTTLLPALVGPLEDRDIRDALIGWLCPGWLPFDVFDERLLRRLDDLVGLPEDEDEDLVTRGDRRQDVLDRLCRATPDRFAAPVLTMAASHAWWRGNGAKAGICIDRALELDPDHRLARLIRLGLDHGIRMPAA